MGRDGLERRLSSYWKMEAANVLVIPLSVLLLARTNGWALGLASWTALVPVCVLLAIGAGYWREKLRQLRSRSAHPQGIELLARLQAPALGLTLGAAALTVAAWMVPGVAPSQADRWTALVLTLLALAEYVNYYHRQLQHFDHWADFRRLLTGRGLRRSQMSLDLARWRARGS